MNIQDIGFTNIGSQEDILKSAKKKKIKKSIFSEPVEVEPILNTINNQKIEQIKQKTNVDLIKQQLTDRLKDGLKSQQVQQQNLPKEEFEVINQKTKEEFEIAKNEILPENINYVELESDITEALDNIPDSDNFNIDDIEIKKIDKKTKGGYYKVKVNIGKDILPEQIQVISSFIKKQSKGLIIPRICDLRVIGNTNKTQLKNSNLKLTSSTIVYKPDFTKLKVNKGTRIMLSIPENYSSTNNLLVYIQESRAKQIVEVKSSEFSTFDNFNLFIENLILDFYYLGYDVISKKLNLKNNNNPLMLLVNLVIKNGFKAKPYTDNDGNVYAVDFNTKGTENQWLTVQVNEGDIRDTYTITGINTVDKSEFEIGKKNLTIQYLNENFSNILTKVFAKDWSAQLNTEGEDKIFYLVSKLTYKPLKTLLLKLQDFIDEESKSTNELDQEPINLEILKSLSQNDTAKIINDEYKAESIIGKTNFVDYFLISYLAKEIKGGDKRNYDARKFMFQIEYSIDGKKNKVLALTIDELLDKTLLLTPNPI